MVLFQYVREYVCTLTTCCCCIIYNIVVLFTTMDMLATLTAIAADLTSIMGAEDRYQRLLDTISTKTK